MSRSLGHPLEAAAWGWSQDKDSPGKSHPAPDTHLWPSVFPREVLHPHGPGPRGVTHHPATHPHPSPQLLGSSPGDSWPGCETHLSGGPQVGSEPMSVGAASSQLPWKPSRPAPLSSRVSCPLCPPHPVTCLRGALCPTGGDAGRGPWRLYPPRRVWSGQGWDSHPCPRASAVCCPLPIPFSLPPWPLFSQECMALGPLAYVGDRWAAWDPGPGLGVGMVRLLYHPSPMHGGRN